MVPTDQSKSFNGIFSRSLKSLRILQDPCKDLVKMSIIIGIKLQIPRKILIKSLRILSKIFIGSLNASF